MRHIIYAFCAAVFAMMVYVAAPATVSAEPGVHSIQSTSDSLLQQIQYRKNRDSNWTSEGKPVFRSDRFTRPYCEECRYICNGNRPCPRRCWGWKHSCGRYFWD